MPATKHTHKCAGCEHDIPTWDLACTHCWFRIPVSLRDALTAERKQCRLAGIAHSQELLALQAKALPYLKPKEPTT